MSLMLCDLSTMANHTVRETQQRVIALLNATGVTSDCQVIWLVLKGWSHVILPDGLPGGKRWVIAGTARPDGNQNQTAHLATSGPVWLSHAAIKSSGSARLLWLKTAGGNMKEDVLLARDIVLLSSHVLRFRSCLLSFLWSF